MHIILGILGGLAFLGFLNYMDERENLKRNKQKYGDIE